MNGKREQELIFTYGQRNVNHILIVFLHREGAVRSSAVCVVLVGIGSRHSNRACLGKGTKAEGINDASLVTLTSNELTNSRPNFDC